MKILLFKNTSLLLWSLICLHRNKEKRWSSCVWIKGLTWATALLLNLSAARSTKMASLSLGWKVWWASSRYTKMPRDERAIQRARPLGSFLPAFSSTPITWSWKEEFSKSLSPAKKPKGFSHWRTVIETLLRDCIIVYRKVPDLGKKFPLDPRSIEMLELDLGVNFSLNMKKRWFKHL